MRPHVKEDFDYILDVMAGGDGGGAFVNYMWAMHEFDMKATEGDTSAQFIIEVMRRFARLIRATQAKLEL